MKKFKVSLFLVILCMGVAGCRSTPPPRFPANTWQEIAVQTHGGFPLLVIPVYQAGDELYLGSPSCWSEASAVGDATAYFRQDPDPVATRGGTASPDFLVIFTAEGEVYSVHPTAAPEPVACLVNGSHTQLQYWKTDVDNALLYELREQVGCEEFEVDATSVWAAGLYCDDEAADRTYRVIAYGGNGQDGENGQDEGKRLRIREFLNCMTPRQVRCGPEAFDRTFGRHNVYCVAPWSHAAPEYNRRINLELEYTRHEPVVLNREPFADRQELFAALRLHLASGRYTLIRLKLCDAWDIFDLEEDGIAPALRLLADAYGSDFAVEMPDRTTFWRCSRCFAAP